jgi:hypothetical protein
MRVTTDFCKIWGDAIAKTRLGLSFSEPTASISLVSPDNYREFIAPYHKDLVDYFKAKKVGLTTHICGTTYPIYEDIIGCGFTTVSFDLDQQGDPKLYVDQLERFMESPRARAVRHRQRRRDQVQGEDHAGERWRRTVAAALTRRRSTRASFSRPRARSRRGRGPRREVVHGRGPRLRPLRPRLSASRPPIRGPSATQT